MNMKNLIPEVAKLLGVEIGEEFKVKEMPNDIYKFDEDGNLRYFNRRGQEWLITTTNTLCKVLNGKSEIIKLPWKPKVDEKFWTVENDGVYINTWDNDMSDFMYLKCGNCFRTKEEAEANADRIRKEIMV